ncbi:LysR family transcriptional regulator [Acetobacter persici]|uniref:LysR family transcriptional regulator n=1 Tax=Acetobacter persici TaxID=1076596 RepID=UPI001BAC3D6B|nr:LysR family transcriptional regulator [Acetobacter persici]
MKPTDLNLLHALDILIEEQSVGRTAERLGLSPPSVSRLLARAREIMGDPILVRAGRELVATEYARTQHARIRNIIAEAQDVLLPNTELHLDRLERRFTIRANEGFTAAFASSLAARIAHDAPKAELRFAQEHESDDDALREGRIDLDIGALRAMGPEVRVQTIFRDHHIGLALPDHPIFKTEISPERFVSFPQISVSRRGRAEGPVDQALMAHYGLQRRVSLIVPSFMLAIAALPGTELIALVPRFVLRAVEALGIQLRTFDIPVPLDTLVIAQAWHPRFDRDAAHRFLRQCVREVCAPVRRQDDKTS